MLEQKLKELGEKNLEIRLVYRGSLNGIVVMMIYDDRVHIPLIRAERLIRFQELHAPTPVDVENIFEFNLSNILGNMATKILRGVKNYTEEGASDV